MPWDLVSLFAIPALWMIIQLVPGVPIFLAHPVWLSVPDASARITINPHQTELALLWWFSLSVTFIAIRAGTNPKRVRWFLHLMMWTVLLVAVFGLANVLYGWNSLGLIQKTAYLGWVTGTFVNRNSAASFFVIGLGITSSLGIEAYRTATIHFDRASPIARIMYFLNSSVSIYFIVGAIILIANFQTGSRAGIASSLIVLIAIALITMRETSINRYNVLRAGIVLLVFLVVASNALYERSGDAVDSSWARVGLAREALTAIQARPFLGHGAGAFQSVEPLYHSPETSSQFIWNHVHNSYLEAAVDMGIPITTAWLALAAHLVFRLLRTLLKSNNFKPATIALFAVLSAESFHALVDFSMQTQAIALYVCCLVGLAVGELHIRPGNERLKLNTESL